MAIKFGNDLDIEGNEIKNFVVHSSASAPSTPKGGMMWWDSTNKILKYYNNSLSIWRSVVTGSAGIGILVSDYTNLAAAVTALGATPVTLYINIPQTVTGNLTIPSTMSLEISSPNIISVNTGVTLTINGPLNAGLYRIFAGIGSVAFGSASVKEVYPQWWGAVPYIADSATYDSSAAFQKAVDSGKIVHVSKGDWKCNFTITKSDVIVKGNGGRSTRLFPATNTDLIKIDSTGGSIYHVKLQDLCLRNISGGEHTQLNNSNGITITGPDDYHINDYHSFHNLHIEGFLNGINITGRHIWSDYRNVFIDHSLNNGFQAITSQSVNGLTLSNVTATHSMHHGFYVEKQTSEAFINWNFTFCDAESNGKDTAGSKNSGFYLKNVRDFVFINPHAEANGVGSSDNLDYAFRFAGAYALNMHIIGGYITGSSGGIISEATSSSGVIDNNDLYWTKSGCYGISLTGSFNSDLNARWNITNRNRYSVPSGGTIFNASSDINGNYKHLASNDEPFYWWTSTSSPAPLDLYQHAAIKFNVSAPVTIDTLQNALPGQRVLIAVFKDSSAVTLSSGIMSSGSAVILSAGNVVECVVDCYPDEGKLLVISLKT